MSARFSGLIPPMLTPLDADERLDRAAVRSLVDYLIDGGVDGLFLLGSTGEGSTLRTAVRRELVEATVEAVGGRVPIIVGALQPATAQVVEEVRELAGSGIDGVVATTPYYFAGYSDDELLDHFRRIATASELPLLAYNLPQITKVPINARLVRRLAEVPNVVGMKDSSGAWTEVQEILLTRTDPSFVVLQGAQSMCAISLLAGGDGLIPAHANIYPRLFADLLAAGRRGDVAAVFARQAELDEILRIRGRATLHSLKVLAQALGLTQDHLTAPLPRLTVEEAAQFIEASMAAGLRLPAAATS